MLCQALETVDRRWAEEERNALEAVEAGGHHADSVSRTTP
jgi:hypothetical protein